MSREGEAAQARVILEKDLAKWEVLAAAQPNACPGFHEAYCAVLLATALDSSTPLGVERRAALLARASARLDARKASGPVTHEDAELVEKIKILRDAEPAAAHEIVAVSAAPR